MHVYDTTPIFFSILDFASSKLFSPTLHYLIVIVCILKLDQYAHLVVVADDRELCDESEWIVEMLLVDEEGLFVF